MRNHTGRITFVPLGNGRLAEMPVLLDFLIQPLGRRWIIDTMIPLLLQRDTSRNYLGLVGL